MSKSIGFYDAEEKPYGVFSNFYPHELEINGKNYSSVEHYFQSSKFDFPGASVESVVYADEIAQCSTSNKARVLGLQKTGGGYKWRTDLNVFITKSLAAGVVCRSDWDSIKLDVMYRGVSAKFSQNSALRDVLMSTGSAIIQEASPRDEFWGIGKSKTGSNHLGLILMRVRAELVGNSVDGGLAATSSVVNVKSEKKRKIADLTTSHSVVDRSESNESKSNPTNTSNWIDDRIIAGSYPGTIDPTEHRSILASIVNSGVNVFISLMQPKEAAKFNEYQSFVNKLTRDSVKYYNFPIADKQTASTELLLEVVSLMKSLLREDQNTVIYLHCHGGHGRTGLVSTLYLSSKYKLNSDSALKLWYEKHETRERFTSSKLSKLTAVQLKKLAELDKIWE